MPEEDRSARAVVLAGGGLEANLEMRTRYLTGFVVTCGITFTSGGLRISEKAEVLDLTDRPIPGLYAAGGAGRGDLLRELSRRRGADVGGGVRAAG